MKKISKLSLSLVLALILVMNSAVAIMAADSTITFNGHKEGFAFEPGSEYMHTDLFGNFKDVMPGDKLTETITIANNATDHDYIKLFMRAAVHDEEGNPLTYSEAYEAEDGKDQAGVEGERDETVVTMADFLAQLSMKVYENGSLIYEASPDELDGMANNVYLGTFHKSWITTLTVELEVPMELGNEYANRVGEVDWIFFAESYDDPEPTPTPIPGVVAPDTGDNSNIGLYIGIAAVCIVCGVILFVVRKKTSKQREEQ